MMRIFNVVLAVLLLGGLALVANTGQRRLLGMALLAPMIPWGSSSQPRSTPAVGPLSGSPSLPWVCSSPPMRRHARVTWSPPASRSSAPPKRSALAATRGPISASRPRRSRSRRCVGRKGWLLTRLPGFVAIGLIGLVTFVTNSQAGLIGSTRTRSSTKPTHLFYYNLTELPNILIGMFGGWALGWLDNPMPAVVSSSSLFAAIFVIVTGIQRFPSARHSRRD